MALEGGQKGGAVHAFVGMVDRCIVGREDSRTFRVGRPESRPNFGPYDGTHAVPEPVVVSSALGWQETKREIPERDAIFIRCEGHVTLPKSRHLRGLRPVAGLLDCCKCQELHFDIVIRSDRRHTWRGSIPTRTRTPLERHSDRPAEILSGPAGVEPVFEGRNHSGLRIEFAREIGVFMTRRKISSRQARQLTRNRFRTSGELIQSLRLESFISMIEILPTEAFSVKLPAGAVAVFFTGFFLMASPSEGARSAGAGINPAKGQSKSQKSRRRQRRSPAPQCDRRVRGCVPSHVGRHCPRSRTESPTAAQKGRGR